MKLIPLTQNQVAKVDDDDYEVLSGYKWHAAFDPKTQSFYARRTKRIDGKKRIIQMHMDVARNMIGNISGLLIDHRNSDTLDNQKHNLRSATPSQNRMNQRASKCNKTGYKGVYQHPTTGRFRAQIRAYHIYYDLGWYATAEEAAEAYKKKATELHGDFAKW